MPYNAVVSRIPRLVQRLKDECGSWDNVSDELRRINGGGKAPTIERRILPRLADEKKVGKTRLSIHQLICLDRAFAERDEPPLFVRDQTLLDTIAESEKVDFLVSTRFHDDLQTDAVSGWDLDAITNLLGTELGRRKIGLTKFVQNQPVEVERNRRERCAVIGVGSPIANEASDRMLMRMLDMDKINKRTKVTELPFFIIGRDVQDAKVKSGFVRKPLAALAKGAEGAQLIDPRYRALVVDQRAYVCDQKIDYAMLVAQRNPDGGDVWAVLAGLSGPGTHQLAKILAEEKLTTTLPPLTKGLRHPPILVCVFELALEGRAWPSRQSSKGKPGKRVTSDTRRVLTSIAADPPRLFRFEDGAWRVQNWTP